VYVSEIMRWRWSWSWSFVLVVACAHESKVAEDVHGASPAPSATPSAAGADAGPQARLAITNLEPGVFELASEAPLRLQTEATLERKTPAGAWEALGSLDLGRGYRLVESCSQDTPCVDLAPGKPLVPVPWSGFDCSAQCNGTCRANAFEGPGTFHLVARACEGGATFTGPDFELPTVLRVHDLERWGLVSDVTKITVMRLDFPKSGFDVASPAAPDRVAGFVVRAGTEHPLDQATMNAFATLVRDDGGFDDQTLDRCRSRDLVGLRVERTLPTTAEAPRTATAEIALDFACDKLFGAHGGSAGMPRKALATHFAPSRNAFLALVKRALPGDTEIAKLK
jgi:hypothetical protein